MVSTVIIGSGPAALALGYILQGHKPVYDPSLHGPHPDAFLHELLLKHADLLSASTDPDLLNYVSSSGNFVSFFSASVAPVNLLIDALRFGDELAAASPASQLNSRIRWIDTLPITDFVIVGDQIGGQWASQVVDDPKTLAISYVEMLSLPAYSLSEHLHLGEPFIRPSRAAVAEYYNAYCRRFELPLVEGTVDKISRQSGARQCSPRFRIEVQTSSAVGATPLFCDNIVLATGVNGLADTAYDVPASGSEPIGSKVAVIGSGLSAADAILAAWADNKDVIHEFNCPESLKRYPKSLYPEYYDVYLAMTQGAPRYEHGTAGPEVAHKYRRGRSGSLSFAQDILPFAGERVTRTTLNGHLEGLGFKLASRVWACGSICGDTTVRYLMGTCCAVAAELRQHAPNQPDPGPARATLVCRSRSPALTNSRHTAPCCARDASPSRAG